MPAKVVTLKINKGKKAAVVVSSSSEEEEEGAGSPSSKGSSSKKTPTKIVRSGLRQKRPLDQQDNYSETEYPVTPTKKFKGGFASWAVFHINDTYREEPIH